MLGAIMSDDEAAIRHLIDTWMTASLQGETEIVLSLMTDDVVFLTPGQAPFGRKGFAERQKAMHGMRIEGKSTIKEVVVAGNFAYAWSGLDVSVLPKEGKPVRRRGAALSVFRREPNGRWLLARDANLLGPADEAARMTKP